MNGSFDITLRFDSPILLGDAKAGEVDPAGRLRPASVRGMLRFWTRALVAPFVPQGRKVENCLREVESLLFGEAAGDSKSSAPLRIFDVSEGPFDPAVDCPNVPGSGRGTSKGYPAGGERTLSFRPRASVSVPEYSAMLWAVVWTGFSLGALGKRSRRGYGSMSIIRASGVPPLNGVEGGLPLFDDVRDEQVLAERLCNGIAAARSYVAKWLEACHEKKMLCWGENITLDPHQVRMRDDMFVLASVDQVRIGKGYRTYEQALKELMRACSREHGPSDEEKAIYAGHLGYAMDPRPYESDKKKREKRGKLTRWASPFIVRLHQTAGDVRPVVTYSRRFIELRDHTKAPYYSKQQTRGAEKVEAVRRAIGAHGGESGERTVSALAKADSSGER